MTRALPFTEASLARAIKAVLRAGLHVVGMKTDGTLSDFGGNYEDFLSSQGVQ